MELPPSGPTAQDNEDDPQDFMSQKAFMRGRVQYFLDLYRDNNVGLKDKDGITLTRLIISFLKTLREDIENNTFYEYFNPREIDDFFLVMASCDLEHDEENVPFVLPDLSTLLEGVQEGLKTEFNTFVRILDLKPLRIVITPRGDIRRAEILLDIPVDKLGVGLSYPNEQVELVKIYFENRSEEEKEYEGDTRFELVFCVKRQDGALWIDRFAEWDHVNKEFIWGRDAADGAAI